MKKYRRRTKGRKREQVRMGMAAGSWESNARHRQQLQGREKLQMPTQNSQAATPALGITGACPSVCLRAPES